MLDPSDLYRLHPLATDDPDDEPLLLDRPVLVHVLTGFVDAGSATRMVSDHLLATLDHQVLVTFDVDQLVDYRSRRPTMVYDEDHYASYDEPELVLHGVRDQNGQTFLLLTGPEPDTQWERFVAAVIELVEHFDVSTTIGLHAIGMPVPHTRPLGIISHANRAGLVSTEQPWSGRVQLPGSAAALLELRLGQVAHPGLGFVVQVPHYLADTPYPEAAAVLLERFATHVGLVVSREDLLGAAEETRQAITEQIAGSPEVSRIVRELEEQYDTHARGRTMPSLLAPTDGALPSAEELGAEVEKFLAAQTPDD